MSENYQNLISVFLEKLTAEDGLSPNTISSYKKDLELFAKFLQQTKTPFTQVESSTIKQYLFELHKLDFQSSSVARKISCFKSFFKFLENENLIEASPTLYLKAPKRESRLPKFLTEQEIFKMFEVISADKSEFGIRLSCLLEICYSAGLRVSELVSLPISAIQFEGNKLRNYIVIKGKGNKERIAPLNKSAIASLLQYLQLRKESDHSASRWLFVGHCRTKKQEMVLSGKTAIKSQKGRYNETKIAGYSHLSRRRFDQMLKELAIKSGIDPSRVHPHVIRHSFATHLLNSGVDLRILQELLGHNDISTTEIYTHILDSKLRDLVFKFHPLNKN